MKKIIYLTTIFLGVLIASCDYVGNPYPTRNVNLGDTSTCPAPTFPTVTSHVKKILIEDYTADRCPNCPRAARILHVIDSTYPGKIIGLAAHVSSSLASPLPGFGGPSYSFIDDYRTSVGNIYDALLINGNNGLPQGMINRKDYDAVNLTHRKFYLNWQAFVNGIIAEPSVVDLQININYDASTRKICCAVRDSFLSSVPGTFRLVGLITQDSIIGWQDDIDHGIVSNYVFNEMLRDAITPTGAWGELLVTGSASAGLKHINKFAYNVPSGYSSPAAGSTPIPCDVNKCHIVAFIYNTATYEIIQSEVVKITP